MAARPTRRQFLVGAAGTLGVTGALGAGTLLVGQELPAPPPQRVPNPSTPAVGDAVGATEWVASEARGRAVRLVTVVPPGLDRATLPVCLGLHGLNGNALWWTDRGTRRALGQAWARGVPPFAMVALDGGNNYWHPFRASDDPMRMVLDELPGWLRERGIGTAAVAGTGGVPGEPSLVTGVSMGGAGSLMYARARQVDGRPVAAVAALSPGLFTDWRVASRRSFAGRADWAANDPLRFYPELAGVPTGVWCGDRDPFVGATRRYITLARPEVGRIGPGRHDGVFYGRVLPEAVTFLGRHLRRVTASGTARPLG